MAISVLAHLAGGKGTDAQAAPKRDDRRGSDGDGSQQDEYARRDAMVRLERLSKENARSN